MSGFSSVARPGSLPTSGAGRNQITPEALFGNADETAAYRKMLAMAGPDALSGGPTPFKVKSVKVRIFDLSDEDQVAEYEKLMAELLEKRSRLEVSVETRKDLVNRKDGTSYWMKYVEYVEFGGSEDRGKKDRRNDK